jgi:hypothetical protein
MPRVLPVTFDAHAAGVRGKPLGFRTNSARSMAGISVSMVVLELGTI